MKRLIALWVGLLVMVPVGATANTVPVGSASLDAQTTCVLAGVSSSATVVTDTQVDENSPTSNGGGASSMDTKSEAGKNRRVYIRFDLTACSPAIPASATVRSARLELFVTSIASVCRTIDVFRSSSTWAESTLTWNNQPIGTTGNNPPTAQRTSFNTVGSAPCTITSTNTYVTWDVTPDVAAFVSGTATNHGWILRDDAEDGGTNRTTRFSAREANNIPRSPRLIVVYRP